MRASIVISWKSSRDALTFCEFAVLNQTRELHGQEELFPSIQLEILQGKFLKLINCGFMIKATFPHVSEGT